MSSESAEDEVRSLRAEVAILTAERDFFARQWRSSLRDLGRYARPGETRASLEARVDRAVEDSMAWLKQKQGA